MIDLKALVDLVRFVFRKTFVRAVLLFFLIIVISSLFPATRGIYDRVVNRPELILVQHKPAPDAQLGAEWWYQRVAVIENRGTASADDVFISVAAPGGKITRYEVFADQPYSIHQSSDTVRGYLLVTLADLAPGAKSTLYVWGAQATSIGIPSITFAAVHKSGSAPASVQMSSAEQIQSAARQVLSDLRESLAFVSGSVRARTPASLPEGGDPSVLIPQIPPFLVVAAIALAVLAWAFLGSTRAAFVHGGLAAGIYWLLVENFTVSPQTLILCSVPFLIVSISKVGLGGMLRYSLLDFLLRERSGIAGLSGDGWWILNLSMLLLVIGLILSTPWLVVLLPQWMHIESIRQMTGYLLVGYLGTMISFSVL